MPAPAAPWSARTCCPRSSEFRWCSSLAIRIYFSYWYSPVHLHQHRWNNCDHLCLFSSYFSSATSAPQESPHLLNCFANPQLRCSAMAWNLQLRTYWVMPHAFPPAYHQQRQSPDWNSWLNCCSNLMTKRHVGIQTFLRRQCLSFLWPCSLALDCLHRIHFHTRLPLRCKMAVASECASYHRIFCFHPSRCCWVVGFWCAIRRPVWHWNVRWFVWWWPSCSIGSSRFICASSVWIHHRWSCQQGLRISRDLIIYFPQSVVFGELGFGLFLLLQYFDP